eukprot:ctg_166.g98
MHHLGGVEQHIGHVMNDENNQPQSHPAPCIRQDDKRHRRQMVRDHLRKVSPPGVVPEQEKDARAVVPQFKEIVQPEDVAHRRQVLPKRFHDGRSEEFDAPVLTSVHQKAAQETAYVEEGVEAVLSDLLAPSQGALLAAQVTERQRLQKKLLQQVPQQRQPHEHGRARDQVTPHAHGRIVRLPRHLRSVQLLLMLQAVKNLPARSKNAWRSDMGLLRERMTGAYFLGGGRRENAEARKT